MVVWGSTLGLYSLAVLVPFIILYLIRPRPKELQIPSLMFFLKQQGVRQHSSFLRNFLKDLLFIIQLLILLALCFALAEPLIDVISSYRAEETVIVFDVSASMTADNRFQKAKDFALKNIGKRTTIILAKDVPVTILEHGDSSAAHSIISNLKPSATNTNIGDAMKAAGDKLSVGRVVVVSDFLFNKGLDPIVAKSVLEARGLEVDFFPVDGGSVNYAITNIDLSFEKARIYVKNYNDKKKTVEVKVGDLKKRLEIDAQSVETFAIKPPEGVTKVEITSDDDMPVDNFAYINIPTLKKTKVLLITNNEKGFLRAAIQAIPHIDLQVSIPPIIPPINHDVIILSEVNIQKILSGTFQEIDTKVRQGASVIYTGQEILPTASTMPFLQTTLSKQGSKISIDILNHLTKGTEFGRVSTHHKGHAVNGSVIILSTEQADPILVVKEYGKGFGIYYGIFDSVSDFKLSPSYPIFWSNLLKFLTGEQNLEKFNKRTGEILTLGKQQTIQTPEGPVQTKTLLIDNIGVYQMPNYFIVGNLFSDRESNIVTEAGKSSISKTIEQEGTQKRKESLAKYLLWAALCLVILEIWYIKYRGDL